MALRSFFGRSLMRTSAPTRSNSLNMPQGPSKDLSEWFSESFSSQPDSINRIMNLIYTQSPSNNVTPFNLFCRSSLERWTIKGLRVGPKEKTAHKRHVVVASGIQAYERIPVGVTLYVAAALSRKPIPGVEVSFFPVLKPKEFELQWHNEQTSHARSSLGLPLGTEDPINLSSEEYERGVDAPLRNYAMRRGSNFVDVVMDLAHTGSTLQLKHNSLIRPKRQAGLAMHNFPSHPQLAMPNFAEEGTQSLFDQLISPPTVILELRDKQGAMDEDQIVQCGQQVIRTIHNLLEETNGTKPLL